MNLELTLGDYCAVSCAKKEIILGNINCLGHLCQCESQNQEPRYILTK